MMVSGPLESHILLLRVTLKINYSFIQITKNVENKKKLKKKPKVKRDQRVMKL
jgi:hypothetical protein